MLRSDSPSSPPRPHGGKHEPPPNPDDRYAPCNSIRLDMVDLDGMPTTVVISRRAARDLAEQLYTILCIDPPKGGV